MLGEFPMPLHRVNRFWHFHRKLGQTIPLIRPFRPLNCENRQMEITPSEFSPLNHD